MITKEEAMKENRKYITICPQCRRIPLISILTTNPIKVAVICKCSIKIILLSQYLQELNQYLSSQPLYYCQLHSTKEYVSYCKICNQYLCYDCWGSHDLAHFLFPIDINSNLRKDIEHPHSDAFCHNCFEDFCIKCDKGHEEHIITHLSEITKKRCTSTLTKIMRINSSFINILENTKKQVLSKFPNDINQIEKSYKECRQRNADIMSFIFRLGKAYTIMYDKKKQCFQTSINVINNTDFTINPFNYNVLPIIKNPSDAIRFFDTFYIIKERQYYKCLSFMKFKRITISNITKYRGMLPLNDNNKIIITDIKGDLLLYDIEKEQIVNMLNKAHSNIIESVIPLSNSRIATCSWDKTVKVWKVDDNISLLNSFICHEEKVLSLVELSDNRIASISEKGKMIIHSLDDKSILFSDEVVSPEYISSYALYLTKDKHTLIVLNCKEEIMFYDAYSYVKSKKSIQGIKLVGKYSFYESKEGLLYIGGTSTKKGTVSIFSINLDSLSIESITTLPIIFHNNNPPLFLLYETEESLLIRTHYSKLIEFDKKTKSITHAFPERTNWKFTYNEYSIKHNSFIALANSNTIIIWDLQLIETIQGQYDYLMNLWPAVPKGNIDK